MAVSGILARSKGNTGSGKATGTSSISDTEVCIATGTSSISDTKECVIVSPEASAADCCGAAPSISGVSPWGEKGEEVPESCSSEVGEHYSGGMLMGIGSDGRRSPSGPNSLRKEGGIRKKKKAVGMAGYQRPRTQGRNKPS